MSYNDIPSLETWQKDTTINGNRDTEFLSSIDNALSDLLSVNNNSQSQKSSEFPGFLMLCLRYQILRSLENISKSELSTKITYLSDAVKNKLAIIYKTDKNQELDIVFNQSVTKGMTKEAFVTDTNEIFPATYLNPKQLWLYKVYIDTGILKQFAWWSQSTPDQKSQKHTVSTLDYPTLELDYNNWVQSKNQPVSNAAVVETNPDCTALLEPIIIDVNCKDTPIVDKYDSQKKYWNIKLKETTEIFLNVYIENGESYLLGKNPKNNNKIEKAPVSITIPSEDELIEVSQNGSIKCGKWLIGQDVADVSRKADKVSKGWLTNYGRDAGKHWGGYVLGIDGELYMTKHATGSQGAVFHSFYFSGKPILSAGALMVDPNGHLIAVSNLSGHYRPSASTLLYVLSYFQRNKVDLSNVVVVVLLRARYKNSFFPDVAPKYGFYCAEDFLKSHGRCDPLGEDEGQGDGEYKAKIRKLIGKNRKAQAGDNATTIDFAKDDETLKNMFDNIFNAQV